MKFAKTKQTFLELKFFITVVLLIFAIVSSRAQIKEEKEVIASVIYSLFEGMSTGDTIKLRSVFHPEANLMSTHLNDKGRSVLSKINLDKFIRSIGENKEHIYDERITKMDIYIDDHLATAWTPYQFYLDGQFSHCGVNAFQFVKTDSIWKIIHLVDTRRKDNCIQD
jgi:hypothetical protein